ncbi:MAG TPA: protein kinase [Candidatus Sulfotelmatobacter sp.]|nr:protein kinase [Candidatus Sulfotelmatobacter sp.]
MTQHRNSDDETTRPARPVSDSSGAERRQETVLLSDVADAPALIAEISAPALANSNLSSLSLAALGQRYDILGEAGTGSMGNVYKARDRETGETVALKLLKPEIASDQAMMERFKNELLFARKITHKNVCRVHEFNRIGGIAYTSMEFVEGESLRSVLSRFGGLPQRKAIDVALQICSGLKEAHAQGIVHRDLKPENVMIDAQGNVKIMDFGIARSMEAGTRLTGSMVGTPAYMAPEQVSGKQVDYRTDIYSLGLMLYEMFTGTQAFNGDTPVAVALKQIRETPPAPHVIEPSIPVPIERAILKCLEKEPARRFQSVGELEKVLRAPAAALAGAPVAPARILSSHAPAPIPIFTPAVEREERHTSPFMLVFLGALLALAGWASYRLANVAKEAEQIQAPAGPPAPPPPDFAYEKPGETAETPAPDSTTPATPAASPQVEEPPAAAPKPAAPKAPAQKPAQAPPTAEGQQRAERSFDGVPVPQTPKGKTYLWVGRFQKEDRAQEAAKKIEELGLPVEIVPKRNGNQQVYVVFAGPFSAERVPSVKQWLQSQGFLTVRSIDKPPVDMNQ